MIERCSRCGAPAGAMMGFDYEESRVWLVEIGADEPGYPLCEVHAARLTPPVGWVLTDRRRPVRPLFVARDVA